jgi:hypothetical protein
MYNRETILQSLNTENYYIDKHSLDLFLEDWKIESIYEDENGLEFFDDLALEKIKKGISLKAQGYSDEQIITKVSRMEAKANEGALTSEEVKTIEDAETQLQEEDSIESIQEANSKIQPLIIGVDGKERTAAEVSAEIMSKEEMTNPVETIPQGKNFTLDVSSQTLQMLAEAVAKKISDDIANSSMTEKLIEAGGYKRDNEILAKQVQELLEHNKELSQRIEHLESNASKNFWSRFWGGR